MEGLAADGYRNTSIRGIGRALGLEPAHILYYFDSREELLQKVIERWDDDAMAHLGGEIRPEVALDSYVETIRHNLKIPGIVHLYLTFAAEAVHPDTSSHEFFRERFAFVRAMLETGIRFEQESGRPSRIRSVRSSDAPTGAGCSNPRMTRQCRSASPEKGYQ